MMSIFLGLLLLPAVYFLTATLIPHPFGRFLGVVSALLLGFHPWCMHIDYFIHNGRFSVITAAIMGSLALMISRRASFWSNSIAGFLASIGVYFHGSSRIMPLFVTILAVVQWIRPQSERRQQFLFRYSVVIITALLVAGPLMFYLGHHPEITRYKMMRFFLFDYGEANQTDEILKDNKQPVLLTAPFVNRSETMEIIRKETPLLSSIPDLNTIPSKYKSNLIKLTKGFFLQTPKRPHALRYDGPLMNPFIVFLIIMSFISGKHVEHQNLIVTGCLIIWFLVMGLIKPGQWYGWYYLTGIALCLILASLGLWSLLNLPFLSVSLRRILSLIIFLSAFGIKFTLSRESFMCHPRNKTWNLIFITS